MRGRFRRGAGDRRCLSGRPGRGARGGEGRCLGARGRRSRSMSRRIGRCGRCGEGRAAGDGGCLSGRVGWRWRRTDDHTRRGGADRGAACRGRHAVRIDACHIGYRRGVDQRERATRGNPIVYVGQRRWLNGLGHPVDCTRRCACRDTTRIACCHLATWCKRGVLDTGG